MTIEEAKQRLDDWYNGEDVNISPEFLDVCNEALKFKSRAEELLNAVVKLLNKQNESFFILNLLEETVYYDECDCDGYCLLEDIKELLECGE